MKTNTIITGFSTAAEKINKFLHGNSKSLYLQFKDGAFIEVKKHIRKKGAFLEIHTGGYDGEFTAIEGVEWLKWELIDRRAEGYLS